MEGIIMRLVQMVLALAFLASCTERLAPGDAVRDSDSAIRIAQTRCSIGPTNMKLSPDDWHATLRGDYWKVWQGTRENGHAFLDISIAKKDGTPTECLMTIK